MNSPYGLFDNLAHTANSANDGPLGCGPPARLSPYGLFDNLAHTANSANDGPSGCGPPARLSLYAPRYKLKLRCCINSIGRCGSLRRSIRNVESPARSL